MYWFTTTLTLTSLCLTTARGRGGFSVWTGNNIRVPLSPRELFLDEVFVHDQFVYQRYFRTEQLVCETANTTLHSLRSDFYRRLENALYPVGNQLKLSTELSHDAGGQQCVKYLGDSLMKEIEKGTYYFLSCSIAANAKLGTSLMLLHQRQYEYYNTKMQTIQNINNCVTNKYVSKDLEQFRDRCVTSNKRRFESTARRTADMYRYDSPCMEIFEKSVVGCMHQSIEIINNKTSDILKRLSRCNLGENGEEPQFTPVKIEPKILEQIKSAQEKIQGVNANIEKELKNYYRLESKAIAKYATELRDEQYYADLLKELLKSYFQSIKVAAKENPKEKACFVKAHNGMLNTLGLGSKAYFTCNQESIHHVTYYMTDIRKQLFKIVFRLPIYGNAAILECISSSVFGENAIEDCFDLKSRWFSIDTDHILQYVKELLTDTINNYEIPDFRLPGSTKPCGKQTEKQLLLYADMILGMCKQCLYRSSGRNYYVTTPHSMVEPDPTTTSRPMTSYPPTAIYLH